jgi:threonine-phosphate decarboxylase
MEGKGVSRYYQKRFGLSPVNILAGNGSTELIYLVPRALRFEKVAIITPSYHDYERASIMAGATVIRVPTSVEKEFVFTSTTDLPAILKEVDALWLGRPNNPTGSMVSKEQILELAQRFPDTWFIVDEAFIQFVEDWENKSLLNETPRANILVLHSLTKFYALAGLRLGGLVGDAEAILRLKKGKEPWTVNGISEKVAGVLLECEDYEQKTASMISKERERIYRRIMELDGIRVFPPSANFFLCQWSRGLNLDDLFRYLLSNGIYVRDCRNFPGLEGGFFRFGLKSSWENDALISLIASSPYG